MSIMQIVQSQGARSAQDVGAVVFNVVYRVALLPAATDDSHVVWRPFRPPLSSGILVCSIEVAFRSFATVISMRRAKCAPPAGSTQRPVPNLSWNSAIQISRSSTCPGKHLVSQKGRTHQGAGSRPICPGAQCKCLPRCAMTLGMLPHVSMRISSI